MKIFFSILALVIFATQDDFTFISNNRKVVLKIDEGRRNLRWGKKSILNLTLENISPQRLTMSAPGIRFIKSDNSNDEVNLEITPEKGIIENDTLILNIGFRDNNNENYISHRFVILIRE